MKTSSPQTFETIVIGSGINGLVAAAELAGAGQRVALVERNPQIGGFIASGELTHPGFTHDTYSSWHPLFVAGAAYGELGADLHRHGLEYANSDGYVTGSVAADGSVTLAHRDARQTAAAFRAPGDSQAYQAMLGELGSRAQTVFGVLGSELRGAALGTSLGAMNLSWGTLKNLRARGIEALVRDAVTSGRNYCSARFAGPEADHLWAPWLLHAGLSPDSASGGVMLPLMALTMHQFGLPIVRGGAGQFVRAFEALLRERGVTIYTGAEVTQVLVKDQRAYGCVVASTMPGTPENLYATEAVLASVTPQALYGDLVPQPPAEVAAEASAYRYGRGAMQIHVALNRPVPWSDPRLAEVPLLHLSDGSATTAIACAEAEAGLLPRHATVVVGQQSLLDPTRAPEGQATLWIQLQEVPYQPVGDAAGELDPSGGWDASLKHDYARRIFERIERHAPGFGESILAFEVIAPTDLEAANPNARRGDPYSGSAELDQNLLWRPTPSAHHKTKVDGLWHIGASTHPGPGLGGGSGHIVAQTLLGGQRRAQQRDVMIGRAKKIWNQVADATLKRK
ncbi:NAD(P)/FAD-dependent oxidoreductase [Micrococcales bacterium 31B]|nr:NAD(P)/FAD-dependent oxidoreductase [Micrococcales bacterium 31B]